MSTSLTTADLQAIQGALRILASPQTSPDLTSWRRAVLHAVGTLLGAETSASLLPVPGEVPFLCNRPIALDQYASYYQSLDPSPRYRKTEAFAWSSFRNRYERPDRSAWLRSEFYNDWVVPQRLLQPCGLILVRTPAEMFAQLLSDWAGMAGLWFYRDSEATDQDDERTLTILGLLLPAFEAGVTIMAHAKRLSLGGAPLLEALSEGVLLVDSDGRVRYENRAFARHLAGEAEIQRVRSACVLLGCAAVRVAEGRGSKAHPIDPGLPLTRDLKTANAGYRLSATFVGVVQNGPPSAAVLVQRRGGPAPRQDLIQHRFGLTRREAVIACLLTEGLSNQALAVRLGITVHTVRRHVEHIMMKVGVHNRGAVAAAVRAEG